MSPQKISTQAIVSALLFWFAGLLAIAAFGLVPGMETDTPLLAFCVSTPFATIMVGVALSICRQLIHATGLANGITTGRLLAKLAILLVGRPALRSVAAFLSPLVLALQYWETDRGFVLKLPGVTEASLIAAMRIEFLLIHGFPFLIFWAFLAIHRLGVIRVAGASIFVLVAALYAGAATSVAGSYQGALIFLYLLIPDIIAFARRGLDGYVRPRLALRWTLQFLGMLSALVISGTEFTQNSATFQAGLLFFLRIALMEFFRLADIPLDIAEACNASGSAWTPA
ncbi:MAG: hypothetical protein IT318_15545 [Anaerolineales bacterium]|nr:hypothetical protein [Anaerolineales bacterium]